jgi:hypothetical protein
VLVSGAVDVGASAAPSFVLAALDVEVRRASRLIAMMSHWGGLIWAGHIGGVRTNNAVGDRLITPRGPHVAAPKCSEGLACTLIMNHDEILIKTLGKCF